jgi:beta-N-acetylhexosaminidase
VVDSSKAFIAGIAGPALTPDEREFLRAERPWGLILFKRNIESKAQVTDLVTEIRQILKRSNAPLLVDQEGGRVQRMQPPVWPSYPPGAAFGRLFDRDPAKGLRAARLSARLIAADLSDVGIDVDCLPIVDVPIAGSDNVIGDRAYGTNPATVSAVGRAVADGLRDGGVLPILKHIPGHGRALVDSHHLLPVVDTPRDELDAIDFAPFRALADLPMAMTAHVIFSAYDPARPATTSATIVSEVIRGLIGFDGLLMGDDVSMNALDGSIAERSRATIAAGCDIVLACNGKLDEMRAVADSAPELRGEALRRAGRALAAKRPPQPIDIGAARAELDGLVALARDFIA